MKPRRYEPKDFLCYLCGAKPSAHCVVKSTSRRAVATHDERYSAARAVNAYQEMLMRDPKRIVQLLTASLERQEQEAKDAELSHSG